MRSGTVWDPQAYLEYDELRARPFWDLLGRVTADAPRRVVDVGCGPGNLTGELARRWPGAALEAFDHSTDMVAAARGRGIDAQLLDVTDWVPAPDADVVVSNAVLQWVPGHEELLRRWVTRLPSRAWLAIQVPGNLNSPSHRLVRAVAESPEWARRLSRVSLRSPEAVPEPEDYADLFADLGCGVDVWETTYVQRLSGENAVLNWISGTALRPLAAELEPSEWQRFRRQLAPLLREAYPARRDGTTWFPFRRLFAVARTPA